ncbi:hypothetical protein A2856_03335 [Candidatus Uhrbacteria bacterium RIFCSPHIGHO2_01_FULL_63_20]|uniref:Small-conductance mechanosensitive ion channel n=1 Tax=Candidatus Uhrbacteria bacterium RIFCSPHIGHO2_01_FULL_63_20 TaxID=1802385 RepID=A0A1F7TLC7_9BACT|nr:MAG: hypothetical protein A2856_03335 [Candidatus Uhrbacteria bacterium RIFCSPHIGHO2_01_FULL_63_20]
MTPTVNVFQDSLLSLWDEILVSLPNVLAAVVVFVAGLVVAAVLSRIVEKAVELLRLDDLVSRLDLKAALERVGLRLHVGHLLGWIVRWFFVIVSLIAATDILGWEQVTDYLKQVVLYVPNVIIAVIILLAGILLANFVRNVVKSAVEAAQLSSADFLSGIAKWAILVFSFMAALVQLQIATAIINTLFTGLVAMLALSGGLAFGLGGKEHANRVLERLRRDLSSER